ncbi:hypothetical protein ACI3L3_11940 [Desulfobaculum sp. SPO524]|uniref:hypothetical protein n=1 Tax=Desulfobaculum sp. SPO524 TaxID=3378071 RepID=UPI003853EEA0
MRKQKKKEMTVVVVAPEGAANVGILIDGEMCREGDEVTVPLSVGKNLIYRERAVPAGSAAAKAIVASAEESRKASAKGGGKGGGKGK